ncbi:retrovirus-related pol polyprotein from transposon TNT 1-94, partial [Tanacetum coccineum]
GTIFNQNDKVVLIDSRRRDVYVIDMSSYNEESNACFFAKASPSVNWLWHKRLSHLNFENINNLAKHNLVFGLPSLTFSKDKNCLAYKKGKYHRASFKTKRSFSINKSLHLLHIDLFRPVKSQTISHNKFTLVIVDEYSRKMENLNEVRVKELRSDNGTEFRNHKLEEFCDEKVARTMLNSAKLPKQFWGEAVNIARYTQNRSIIVKKHGKTSYDVFRGRSPDISLFLCVWWLKAFRMFNIRRQEIEETIHVTFSEDDEAISQSNTEGDAINFNENISFPDDEFLEPRSKVSVTFEDPIKFTEANDHPALNEPDQTESTDHFEPVEPQNNSIEKHIELVNINGEPLADITTRSRIRDSDAASASECLYVNFLSEMEPKRLIEALEEEGMGYCLMQEELGLGLKGQQG